MANFKSGEIETAVSRYVRDTVKTERTDLGPLDTGYAFDEAREFVASTLVFDPSSVFYLLSLAANRVNQDVIQALDYLDDIITGIGEVGRDTTKVTQTSLLEDAAAALLEVERTIETRNAITAKPFSRYAQALDKFTTKSLTPNIRRLGPGFPDTYEIVRPPQQAQSAIKSDIAALRTLHVTVVEEATQLTESLSEFLAANLPRTAIQRSVSKVRRDLRALKSSLDGSTRDGAIEKTRDAFLAIQAGKAVITNLTSISDPRDARMASSATSSDRASAIASALYPSMSATPAQAAFSVSAPYLITTTANEIKLEVDGGAEQLVTLTPTDPAFILGTSGEFFDIDGTNDELRFITQDSVVVVSLTNGLARTAAQIAADIDASPLLEGLVEVVVTSTGSINVVRVQALGYGEESHIKVESLTAVQEASVRNLGFYEGQEDRGSYFKLTDLVYALSGLTNVETETSYSTPQQGNGGTAVLDGAVYKLRLPSGTITSNPTAADKLRISNGANVGWYAISAVSLGGGFDDISLSRPLPVVSGAEALNQAWEIHRDLLTIKSKNLTTSSKIKVNVASANVALGLVDGLTVGSVSGVRVLDQGVPLNFSREDVVAGDRLTLQGPTYTTVHTVLAVTYDGYQVEVTPEVPDDLVAHFYQIDSAGALAYADFEAALGDWFTDYLEASKFAESIQELERVLNPLLVNKNPSAALVGSANTVANNLLLIYTNLQGVLAGFTTPVVPRINALLDMMQERGMDRAHELLLLGEFQTFFSATQDSASHGGNLLEKMRSIAQNDVPLGRSMRSGNTESRLTGSYEGTDSEFDFSDQDDETGVTQMDNIPDLDDSGNILNGAL